MSFGKNPHVARAQAAEQKANDSSDAAARVRALREAAHQWERAAEREVPGKRRDEYTQRATHNRGLAEGDVIKGDAPESAPPVDTTLLN